MLNLYAIRMLNFMSVWRDGSKRAKPNMLDFLSGIQIKDNPNALRDFIFIIIVLGALVAISIILVRLPKIKRKLWDEEVFKFLLSYKELSSSEIEVLKKIIKKYEIKRKKYNLLILEPTFQKYLDMEMINIEQSSMSARQKDEKINDYVELKKKIFYNNKEEQKYSD